MYSHFDVHPALYIPDDCSRMKPSCKIVDGSLYLVPYEEKHVVRYHAWMQDERLRQETDSEELTLEQEYAMQRDWANSTDKLVFIVTLQASEEHDAPHHNSDVMIGDVNLFLNEYNATAELSVMIAEPQYRRKGYARGAVQLMMAYAMKNMHRRPSDFIAKINEDNSASITMFESLGFMITSRMAAFQQVEMTYSGGPFEYSSTQREIPMTPA